MKSHGLIIAPNFDVSFHKMTNTAFCECFESWIILPVKNWILWSSHIVIQTDHILFQYFRTKKYVYWYHDVKLDSIIAELMNVFVDYIETSNTSCFTPQTRGESWRRRRIIAYKQA